MGDGCFYSWSSLIIDWLQVLIYSSRLPVYNCQVIISLRQISKKCVSLASYPLPQTVTGHVRDCAPSRSVRNLKVCGHVKRRRWIAFSECHRYYSWKTCFAKWYRPTQNWVKMVQLSKALVGTGFVSLHQFPLKATF